MGTVSLSMQVDAGAEDQDAKRHRRSGKALVHLTLGRLGGVVLPPEEVALGARAAGIVREIPMHAKLVQ